MADQKLSLLKKTVLQLGIGVALGFLVACLVGPRLIKIGYEPPIKDAFSCASSVEKALSDFVVMQLVCAALGGFGLWLALFFARRLWRKKPVQAPSE
jgi:hypothetical protein